MKFTMEPVLTNAHIALTRILVWNVYKTPSMIENEVVYANRNGPVFHAKHIQVAAIQSASAATVTHNPTVKHASPTPYYQRQDSANARTVGSVTIAAPSTPPVMQSVMIHSHAMDSVQMTVIDVARTQFRLMEWDAYVWMITPGMAVMNMLESATPCVMDVPVQD